MPIVNGTQVSRALSPSGAGVQTISQPKGETFFLNEVPLVRPEYDGKAYGGNFVDLTGTGATVDLPIIHELGVNILSTYGNDFNAGDETSSYLKVGTDGYTLDVTLVGTSTTFPQVRTDISPLFTEGRRAIIIFDAVVNSGTPIITSIGNGVDTTVNHTVINGENKIEFDTGTWGNAWLRFDGTNLLDISISNTTIKEITVPTNSYITYLDHATLSHKTISASGDTGEELVEEPNFDTQGSWLSLNAGTFTAGKATFESANLDSSFYITAIIEPGKTYQATIVIDSITSGGVKVGEYSTDPADRGEEVFVGTTVITFLGGSGNTNFGVTASSDTTDAVIDSCSVREILPTSTTYNMQDSYQGYFTSNAPVTQADLDALDANPDLLSRVWFNGESLPSGFAKANMVNYIPSNEGLRGSAYVQDLSVDLGVELTPDWLNYAWISTNATITIGLNSINAVSTVDNFFQIFSAPIVTVAGKQYLFTLNVEDASNFTNMFIGAFDLSNDYDYPTDTRVNITEAGKYVYIITALSESTRFYPFKNISDSIIGDNVELTNISIREATAYEIQAYTDATRTNLSNLNVGASNLLLESDASGRPIAVMPPNTIFVG